MIVRILAIILASLTMPPSLYAQDRFGEQVAIVDGDVAVLKPGGNRGLPAVFIYRRDAGGAWRLIERLRSTKDHPAGGLGPSMDAADGVIAVAGGDPDVVWGAHLFRRGAGGTWAADPGVRLRAAPDDDAPATVDLGTVMRILQPAARRVALLENGDLAVASDAGRGTVRVFRPDARGWSESALLRAPGDTAEAYSTRADFGRSLAGGEALVVGAPGGETPLAYVYRDGPVGPEAVLGPGPGTPRVGFGSALAAGGDLIAVQAPLAREVVLYGGAADGRLRAHHITAPDSAAVSFGAAMAVAADEVWIGDPETDDGGRVYRYVHDAGTWHPAGAIRPSSPGASDAFGASIALSADLAVVGAPGARGGSGRVAVFTRQPDGGWSEAEWLSAAPELRMVAGGEVRCEGGEAAGFDCDAVDLLAFLPLDRLDAEPDERVSDLWGWTDPETGREYALVGRSAGLAIVDVTEPTSPVMVGLVPAESSGARDIKVYADHAFMTGDGTRDHGLVIFDLTRVRNAEPGTTFEPDTRYTGITSAHNLVIDTESGFAFTVDSNGGGNTCGGGLHMIDIRDPLQPTFAGCYTDTHGLIAPGRTHDAQCVVYDGPDAEHRGRQICFASNETALRIVDVTDKDAPLPIAAASYPGMAYVHQGWLTDDHRYFFLDDELDELVGLTDRTRTLVWDIEDLDDPVLVHEYFGPNRATDHNLYIRGNRMYQANYQAGLRVIDISDPADPVEIGSFDTTPYDADPPGFVGAWTAFPYFESGTVIVSSMYEGLFVLKPRPGLVP